MAARQNETNQMLWLMDKIIPETVMVVSGGGFQGLALIKALRAAGPVRVVMIDCYAENPSRYAVDAFYRAPRLDHPQDFVAFALDLCRREAVQHIFAATEYELPLLDQHRADFRALGARIWVPETSLLDLTRDKLALYGWLEAQGLPVLLYYEAPRAECLPLIGKPRHGWGGRGIVVLQDAGQLRDAGADLHMGRVWQPWLESFEEYSVDFAIDERGQASPLALRRRVRTSGGFAVLCEPSAPAHVQEVAERLVERLGRSGALGPMNVQLLESPAGCWVSDVNPRIGTSMPLSLAAGVNPLAWLLHSQPSNAELVQVPATKPGVHRVFRSLSERAVAALDLCDVSAVAFDLDDTLLEQKSWMVDKLLLTWEAHRPRLPDRERFLREAWRIFEEGNRARLIDALCEVFGLDARLRDQLIATYRQTRPAQAVLYPDVLPTLLQLKRRGYALGLISDNPPASQRQKLDVAELTAWFDTIVLTGELGVGKPDPRAFLALCEATDLAPSHWVMVGDNLHRDILGALDAGYAHGFFVQREGGFFNFRPGLAKRLGLDLSRCTRVKSLHELSWYLSAPPD